jgi:hypothetical protein
MPAAARTDPHAGTVLKKVNAMNGGVFDRLHKKLQLETQEEGISPLHLADLPPTLRKIMRFMLREVEMSYQGICEAVADLPGDKIEQHELDDALEELRQQYWLIRRGEGDRVTYQVNLRRKAGSKLAAGIWGSLESRIMQAQSPQQAESSDTEPADSE